MTLVEEAIQHATWLQVHNTQMASTSASDPQMKAWYLGKADAADSLLDFFKEARAGEETHG